MSAAITPAALAGALAALRWKRPLVHCITNEVVTNVTANTLLAIGAAPVMAHAPEEVAEIAGRSNALLLNIGTLTRARVESMVLAAEAARRSGVSIVLDPVGVGASAFRREAVEKVLAIGPTLLKGNSAEILTLATGTSAGRGVDADGEDLAACRAAASALASRLGCLVTVTGETDLACDGRRSVIVRNGDPLMGRITGSGCAVGALCAAFLGADVEPLLAVVAALAAFGVAGERAAAGAPGPGAFQVRLLDEVAALTPEALAAEARIA